MSPTIQARIRYVYTEEELKKWKEEVQEFRRLLDKEDLTEARNHKFTRPKGKVVHTDVSLSC